MSRVLSTKEFALVLKLTYVENCLRSAIKFISAVEDQGEDKPLIATRISLEEQLKEVQALKEAIKNA